MDTNRQLPYVLSSIRLLCSTALPSEQVMPEVLRMLHQLVPAVGYNFVWLSPTGQAIRLYCEEPLRDSLDAYRTDGARLMADAGFIPNVLENPAARSYGSWGLTSQSSFLDTEMYAKLCEPCDVAHGWDGLLRSDGELVAAIVLWRGLNDAIVSPEEDALLRSTFHYINHLLATQDATCGATALADDPDRIGWLIASESGQFLHASPDAAALLEQPDCTFFADDRSHVVCDNVQDVIAALVHELRETGCAVGARRPPATQRIKPPPRRIIRTPLGWHVLRAVWLQPVGDVPGVQIGIQVSRRIPEILLALRRMDQLPLSVRQKELCLCLLNHRSSDQIAADLGMKGTTQKDYLRRIYEKLGVHSREELFRLLLSPT